MRSSGFGPDIKTPGGNLRHTLEVHGEPDLFPAGLVAIRHRRAHIRLTGLSRRNRDLDSSRPVQCGMVWLSGVHSQNSTIEPRRRSTASSLSRLPANPLRAAGPWVAPSSHSRNGWPAWTEPDHRLGRLRNPRSRRPDLRTGRPRQLRHRSPRPPHRRRRLEPPPGAQRNSPGRPQRRLGHAT